MMTLWENKGYIKRHRAGDDKRNLTPDDAKKLYEILYKVLGNIEMEGL